MEGQQAREPDASLGGQAVDQSARAAELSVEIIPTADEVVEDMRRQMDELDKQAKEKEAQLEAANNRASAADRARRDAESRAQNAEVAARQAEQTGQRSAEEARLDAVKNSLVTHQGQMTNLKAQHTNALAEGDFAKASDIQGEMAVIGGRIAQLESGAAELEVRVKTPIPDAGRQVQQQDSGDDRREAFIRQQPPRIQDWLRSDKGARYFTDAEFARKVAAAAGYAQNIRNLSIDSQAYLDYVEEQVGLREPAQTEPVRDDRQPSTPGQGRTADAGQRMTTAPAGGANDGSVRRNANGTIDVYLTRDEKEQAARMGVPEAEWAKNKRDLMQEGLIGPGARNR